MSSSDAIVLPSWAASFAATFERVAHHLELSEGFMLLPVELPDSITASLLVDWLRGRGLSCHYIDIDDTAQPRPLLERLLAAPDEATASLIFIDKLTDWLPGALQLLNQQRDVLAHRHPRPLLWCGPARFLDLTWRSAPDLWSVAAVPIRLPTKSQDRLVALTDLLMSMYSAPELRRLVLFYYPEVVDELPARQVSIAQLAFEVVVALDRLDLIDSDFFHNLRSQRPRHRTDIEAVARLWLGAPDSTTSGANVEASRAELQHALGQNRVLFVIGADREHLHHTMQSFLNTLHGTPVIRIMPLLSTDDGESAWTDHPGFATRIMQRERAPEITVVVDAEGRPLDKQDRQQLHEIRRLIHEAGDAMVHARPFQLVIPLAGPNNYDIRLVLRDDLRAAGVPFDVLDLDALGPQSEAP